MIWFEINWDDTDFMLVIQEIAKKSETISLLLSAYNWVKLMRHTPNWEIDYEKMRQFLIKGIRDFLDLSESANDVRAMGITWLNNLKEQCGEE